MKEKKFIVGDKIWYIEPFCEDVVEVKIIDKEENIFTIEVISEDSALSGCTLKAFPTSLFNNEQEAIDARNNRHEDILTYYLNEIKDINSLIEFCLKNCVGGSEDIDYIARKAVIMKSRELGINLKIEQ